MGWGCKSILSSAWFFVPYRERKSLVWQCNKAKSGEKVASTSTRHTTF